MEIVYIETTILGYLASRPSPRQQIAKRQKVTHFWWHEKREACRCVSSELVRLEAREGNLEQARERLKYLEQVEIVELNQEVEELAEIFVQKGRMPLSSLADAVHLASATLAGAHILLTWNCAHLANPDLLKSLRPLADSLGYCLPRVCTPEELMEY